MRLVEGPPSIEAVGQMARLRIPCTKNMAPMTREYALSRSQLTALIAQGIDALDAMDLAQAEAAQNVTPLFAHKATA
jgi:hypothetical protein